MMKVDDEDGGDEDEDDNNEHNDDPYNDKDHNDDDNNNSADDDRGEDMLAGHGGHTEGVEEEGEPKVGEGWVVVSLLTAAVKVKPIFDIDIDIVG